MNYLKATALLWLWKVMRFISDLLSIYRLVGIRITCCWVDKTNFPRSHDNTSSAVGCAVSYTHTDRSRIPKRETTMYIIKLITHRKGKVIFSQVFVCPQSASWLHDHCSTLLWCGRNASYWNAFLFGICLYVWDFKILIQSCSFDLAKSYKSKNQVVHEQKTV